MQRGVVVQLVLAGHAEQRVRGPAGPLHRHAALDVGRHFLVDGPAEVLAVVAGERSMFSHSISNFRVNRNPSLHFRDIPYRLPRFVNETSS